MDLILPYINPQEFANALIKNYGFENQETWNSNMLIFPGSSGNGSLQLFTCNNVHFFRGKWKFNESTLFYSYDPVGLHGYADFRIGADRKMRSCSIEGLKRFEFDTTEVDGIRVFIPAKYLPSDQNKIRRRMEDADEDVHITHLLDEVFATDPHAIVNSIIIENKILQFIAHWREFLWGNDIARYLKDLTSYQTGCIKTAKQFLDENLEKSISIKELSRKCGLNECDLKRYFKELVGLPVRQYLIKARMEKGRRMVQSSDIPLYEIANSLGYQNQSHFVELYVRFFGVHPQNDR